MLVHIYHIDYCQHITDILVTCPAQTINTKTSLSVCINLQANPIPFG